MFHRRGRRELPFLFVGRQRQTKTHLHYGLLAGPYDSLSSIFYLQFFWLSTQHLLLSTKLRSALFYSLSGADS